MFLTIYKPTETSLINISSLYACNFYISSASTVVYIHLPEAGHTSLLFWLTITERSLHADRQPYTISSHSCRCPVTDHKGDTREHYLDPSSGGMRVWPRRHDSWTMDFTKHSNVADFSAMFFEQHWWRYRHSWCRRWLRVTYVSTCWDICWVIFHFIVSSVSSSVTLTYE